MAVDQIRYDRLGYVALNVSDLERARSFYADVLGLQPVASDLRDRAYFRCSDHHHDVALFQGSEPGLKRIGWAMESGTALGAAWTHFTKLGLAPAPVAPGECADLAISEAFRICEPNSGAVFEFFTGMAPAPIPYKATHTKIARLGHVVLNVPDRAAMQKFMVDHFNFRISDEIERSVTFMRCFPNPYHHSLGLSQNARAGLNHVNFMVTEMDDIGKGLWRCKANDAPVVFGPGRHPPSDSIFLYFLDPDGLTLEYSFGMEEFPEMDARPARLLPPGLASIDYWGAVPDMRFAKTGAIEPLGTGATG